MKRLTLSALAALSLMGLAAAPAMAQGRDGGRDGRWEGRHEARRDAWQDRRGGYDRQERRGHRYDRDDRRWDNRGSRVIVSVAPSYYYAAPPTRYYAADPYYSGYSSGYGGYSAAQIQPPSYYGYYGPHYARAPSSQFCLNWNVADSGYRSRWQAAFIGVCL